MGDLEGGEEAFLVILSWYGEGSRPVIVVLLMSCRDG